MAKQSVLGAPSAPAGGSKTGFSMSQNFTFTTAAGMLLPVYKQFLNIGETVTGVPSFFARTEPLLAPAMTDLDVYVDVFFVPMQHLIGMFESWFTQVSDDRTALWTNSNWQNSLPVVADTVTIDGVDYHPNAFGWMTSIMFGATQYYNNQASSISEYVNKSVSYGFGMHRLAMMLDYNAQNFFAPYTDDYTTNPPVSILPEFITVAENKNQTPFCPYFHMAYQKIYYDYYRDSEFESNNVKAYNIDDIMNAGYTFFAPANESDPRFGMFALRYRNRSKDYFTAVHPSPLFNSIGMLPNAAEHLSQIKNWLTGQHPSLIAGTQKSVYINTYPGGELVAGDSDFDTDNDNGRWNYESILRPAYLYNKNINQYNDGEGSTPVNHVHAIDFADAIENDYIGFDPSGDQGIALAQVRASFAMDKLLRVVNRAGKHVDDQLFAQFGVRVPQGVSGEVYKIKSYHSLFHIGEVVQSATTVDSDGNDIPLGEMAGRGVAVLNGNDKFKFTAPCHGILMAIFSISPRYKYAFTQDKSGMKVYLEDFFRPQYDNLGMQPLCEYELGLEDTKPTGVWQYRYMEDKIKYDRATFVFATNSKNPWTFAHTVNLPVVNGSSNLGHCWQKVLPFDTNNMFVTQYASNVGYPTTTDPTPYGTTWSKTSVEFLSNYLRDPFTIDFNMQLSKVSEMSTYGEPSLGGI